MAVLPVQIIAPTFADGYCPGSLQEFANDLQAGSRLSGSITLDNIVISETAPADHTKLWFKVDGALNPFTTIAGVPLYKWSNTLSTWVLRHPELPSSEKVFMYVGTNDAAGLWVLDGGDGTDPSVAGNVTSSTGSFWEVYTAMAGLFPVGVGTINPSSTVVGVTNTGGADQVTQTTAQLAVHDHLIGLDGTTGITTDGDNGCLQTGGTNVNWQAATPANAMGETRNAGGSGSPATTQPMTTTPPYFGIWFIRRTAREFLIG